ncbi:MAG: LysR family transcriptional regulator [Betaproteobacteria bacterium]|jgi:DNA-binding transcriptional LysR family regulator
MNSNARNVLTPDSMSMLKVIAQNGSFAGAARALNLVPSSLTYRVRQIEDALDVLLFDRKSRQAKLTSAGQYLLNEGERILVEIDAISNRVKRIATGWENEFSIALDSLIDRKTVMELCQSFFALSPPTKLRLIDETLTGTLQALTQGHADLALGISWDLGNVAGIEHAPLGEVRFLFCVHPKHPLARLKNPLTDAQIQKYRAVAVADSTQMGQGMTIGLLAGQDVFTVPSMEAKLQAQLLGLGVGFLPEPLVAPYINRGEFVSCELQRSRRPSKVDYAWRKEESANQQLQCGRALGWWLDQLTNEKTRQSLLIHPNHSIQSLNIKAP